jgi:hypothetical protein
MGGCPRIWRITTGTIDQAAEVQQQNLARIHDLYPVHGTARHSCLRSVVLSRRRALWSPYGTSLSISWKKERHTGLQIGAEPGKQDGGVNWRKSESRAPQIEVNQCEFPACHTFSRNHWFVATMLRQFRTLHVENVARNDIYL